jgi:plastocyanin
MNIFIPKALLVVMLGISPTIFAQSLNGCTPGNTVDRTAVLASRAITAVFNNGFRYSPPCMRILTNQSVMFSMSFVSHPLRDGVLSGVTITPQAGNPIVDTSAGSSVSFTFPTTGEFPFVCNVHGPNGNMFGSITVVDPPPLDPIFTDGFE